MTNEQSDAALTAEIEKDIESGRFLKDLHPVRNVAARPPRAVYTLRLSPEEAQEFEAAAKARGVTFSDFLRSCAHASLEADRNTTLGDVRKKARALAEAIKRL
jgi:hypothetical protein